MCSEKISSNWSSKGFDDMFDLAAKPGAGALFLLQPLPGERILDLGCGTGDLTAEIAAAGAIPTGIDLSEEMVSRARQKHPELEFVVGDACHYRSDVRYDAVFSSAAVHWMKDAAAVAGSVRRALRDGGRFVAEFAGSGNVAVLTSAMKQVLEAHGYAWEGRNPWYFPTIGEYASLLEQTGFRVTLAQHFDRPAPIKGAAGLRNWLNMVDGHFFRDIGPADKESICRAIETKVKPSLEHGGQWMLDTSRLRIVAIKEPALNRK